MELSVPILLNIIVVVLIGLLEKKGFFNRLSNLKKQIIIGIILGGVSCFSSEFGVEFMGAILNVRDAAPISAGLIFGPVAGIIAGCIGGGYRAMSILWDAGTYTVVACTIATISAGFVAAVLRIYMFDNKRTSISYALGLTVVLEVFHMLLILTTNFDDPKTAFIFVEKCTILMVIANSIAVGLSVLFVLIINNEFQLKKHSKDKAIADYFQKRLLIAILLSFVVTSLFTFNLQSGFAKKQTNEMFEVTMTDIYNDIKEKSDNALLSIAYKVKDKYLENPDIDLNLLLKGDGYEIREINIVSNEGYVIKSNIKGNVKPNFDMSSSDQSKEFLVLLNQKEETTFVQSYQINGLRIYRKYAGISLDDGGFIQVGYDTKQFHAELDEFVIETTQYRHLGTTGFIIVCDEQFNIVSRKANKGNHISSIGIEINDEMKNGQIASDIYEDEIIGENGVAETHMYVFASMEGYLIIAALPLVEANLTRDLSIHLSFYMEILIFAILFVIIFYLIKKNIIKNLLRVNKDLSQITAGNLDIEVDVRSSEEFSSLSDDINATVKTLKNYISEAAARIDRELEYAKQIQISAIPTNFPKNEKYSIFANMISAKEVGGDFYDFYHLSDNKVAFLIADVSGKGIPAAMFMMKAKTIIKDLAESGLEVNDILTIANNKICENNDSGMFVTAWVGILDLDSGKLKYANAGHNPPLILNDRNEFEYLKSKKGFVLGGIEDIIYKGNEIILGYNDKIFLYTDGVTEANNINQELYGEARLKEFLDRNINKDEKEVLECLKNDIDVFAGDMPQFDDITMLLLTYTNKNVFGKEKEFTAKVEELPNVLSYIEQELESFECNMKTINSILLVVEEIFVNISNYSYRDKIGNCIIKIKFDQIDKEVAITFIDNGVPFNPLEREDPDITLSAEDRNIGGLGIFMVKNIMDEVSYKYDNCNVLTIKKHL